MKKTRILSFILTFAMLLSMMSGFAMAADAAEDMGNITFESMLSEFYLKNERNASSPVYQILDTNNADITNAFYADTLSFYKSNDWESIISYNYQNVAAIVITETVASGKIVNVNHNKTFKGYPLNGYPTHEQDPEVNFQLTLNYTVHASITYDVNTYEITSAPAPIILSPTWPGKDANIAAWTGPAGQSPSAAPELTFYYAGDSYVAANKLSSTFTGKAILNWTEKIRSC